MDKVKNDSRLVIGIILIALGVVLMLETMGFMTLSVQYYIFSWKTFLIFIGLVLFANKKRKVSGIVLMALGFAFWFPAIFGVNIRFHQVFLPLALMGVGALIVSKRGGFKRVDKQFYFKDGEKISEQDIVNDFSIFGGTRKKVDSKQFKGGTITSVFGSTELNLINAEIDPDGCVIDVFNTFAGTTLIVPGDWVVKSDVLSILGGFNDKRMVVKSELNQNKVLILKGIVIFGGIEIKSY